VQTSRSGIRAGTEFSAGVELGKNNFYTAKAGLRFDVYGDSSSLVSHLNASVIVQHDSDCITVAGQGLVYRVIYDFPKTVHEAA
jgi:hypothetical protein